MDIWLSIFGPTTHGESSEQVVEGIHNSGANALMFFSSLYHGYRLIQRRYPHKAIYSLETDRVFYEPDLDFFEDCLLKPRRSVDDPNTDYLAELSKACRNQGVKFSPLVPVCAGEHLAQENPDMAMENLYGSKDRLFLCYNNPEVKKYRIAMVKEITTRYDIDALMLDKIPQTMLEQYAFNGLFDPHLRTVGSFCFCEHCHEIGKKYDLDLNEVKKRCLHIAENSLNIPSHIIESLGDQLKGDTSIPLLQLEEPLIHQMLKFRFNTAVALVTDIKDTIHSIKPGIPLQAAFVPPEYIGHDMTSPRSWLTVQSYKLYRDILDEIFCVVHWDADIVRYETSRAVAAAEGKNKIITSMKLYGKTAPEDVAKLAEAALASGAEGVSFLGYDVASNEQLQSLADWAKKMHIS